VKQIGTMWGSRLASSVANRATRAAFAFASAWSEISGDLRAMGYGIQTSTHFRLIQQIV
jgi:hypothetical protein